MLSYPLISCLTISKNQPEILQRSIRCFFEQTYPNKELIIVYKSHQEYTKSFLSEIKDKRIKSIGIKEDLSLGQMRNISLDNFNGDYFCQWDDDDWYHVDRLKTQYNALVKNHHPVCMLTNLLIYDELNNQVYLSGSRLWEGTILCQKDILNDSENYPTIEKGEDTQFSSKLLSHTRIFPFVSAQLYIYVYHGGNTWNKGHFNMLFSQSQKLSSGLSKLIDDIVHGTYSTTEGSAILDSEKCLKELDYFYLSKNTALS